MKKANLKVLANNDLNKKVAINIVKAQIASDNAKGIESIPYDRKICRNYDGKDKYIMIAIKEIIRKRNTGFSFYVTRDEDICSYLVYFSFDLWGETRQVSFHSYDYDLDKYLSRKSKSHKLVWDQKSSRKSCEILLMAINGIAL